VVESVPSNDAGTQKRRSTRIVQAVPINVAGVDALGQPFKERTTTVMVNCHGCKYQSKHYVPKNSTITLEIPRTEPALPPRTVKGRVVWVQRPKVVRELFQIGLEFETAGNVWGIAFPPDDWFPCAEYETGAVFTASPASGAAKPAAPAAPVPITPEKAEPSARIPAPAATSLGPPAEAAPDNKIHVVPAPAQTAETHLANAQQMAKMVAEAKDTLDKTLRRDAQSAINEEMTFVRQQLDTQLHEAVEHAIKVSMERVSESAGKKFIQQASERSAAIVEEARKASQVNAENLDAKVREAVQRAVSHAAEEAAKQAAEQTAAHNLKHTVEEAVERVIMRREAATPSLGILASPEAAQEHLDQWKKNLEETAHNVRTQTIKQAEADAAAAKQRWNDEFAAAVNNASQTLEERIGHASESAVTRAEQEIAARQTDIRSGLDEAVAGAQSVFQSLGATLEQERARTEEARARLEESAKAALDESRRRLDEMISAQQAEAARKADENIRSGLDDAVAGAQSVFQSLGATLEQERARTEETRARLEESTKAALDESRRRLDEMISAQQAEAAQKADELISERVQHVEPMLQDAARKAMEHFSGEVDQTLAPKLEAAEKTASKLSHASEEAAQAQRSIRENVQQAAEQAKQIQADIREQTRRALQEAEQAQSAIREQTRRASEQVEQVETELREQIQSASEQVVWQSIERVREEAAKLPAELEESFRAVASKAEEEFEQKSTEAQHETFEALSKASDWYQKKAQTTMQSSLEKTVEQSATALRGRAAEISSLVASELDHYRRSYVEHSRGEIEEAAKEVLDRERGKLSESAEMVHAGFSDRVQRVTGESLRRFEEASQQALEKARSDVEYNREASLEEFQKTLDQKMTQGVEQAQVFLQSQLAPLIEALEENRQKQQRDWMENLKKSTEESIEQYKSRLENASNSWLLASATTLGQHSQAVLDTLAKAAEKRMRESIAGVLAGMGDTLKDRLLGLSSDLGADDDDDATPPEKR
jgi:hypothetical protein